MRKCLCICLCWVLFHYFSHTPVHLKFVRIIFCTHTTFPSGCTAVWSSWYWEDPTSQSSGSPHWMLLHSSVWLRAGAEVHRRGLEDGQGALCHGKRACPFDYIHGWDWLHRVVKTWRGIRRWVWLVVSLYMCVLSSLLKYINLIKLILSRGPFLMNLSCA